MRDEEQSLLDKALRDEADCVGRPLTRRERLADLWFECLWALKLAAVIALGVALGTLLARLVARVL